MSPYVSVNEQYLVNITMATEFMQSVLESHKWDKTCACLTTQCDVIGRDSAVAEVPLFIFWCVPAELQLHFRLTANSIRRNRILLLFFFLKAAGTFEEACGAVAALLRHTQTWCFNMLISFQTQQRIQQMWGPDLCQSVVLFFLIPDYISKLDNCSRHKGK